jgi:hypothetical protein
LDPMPAGGNSKPGSAAGDGLTLASVEPVHIQIANAGFDVQLQRTRRP